MEMMFFMHFSGSSKGTNTNKMGLAISKLLPFMAESAIRVLSISDGRAISDAALAGLLIGLGNMVLPKLSHEFPFSGRVQSDHERAVVKARTMLSAIVLSVSVPFFASSIALVFGAQQLDVNE
jgi:hypothetical protein